MGTRERLIPLDSAAPVKVMDSNVNSAVRELSVIINIHVLVIIFKVRIGKANI